MRVNNPSLVVPVNRVSEATDRMIGAVSERDIMERLDRLDRLVGQQQLTINSLTARIKVLESR